MFTIISTDTNLNVDLSVEDPRLSPIYLAILDSNIDKALKLLELASEIMNTIMIYSPLDRDTTSVVLEYIGNLQTQVDFCWSQMATIGWRQNATWIPISDPVTEDATETKKGAQETQKDKQVIRKGKWHGGDLMLMQLLIYHGARFTQLQNQIGESALDSCIKNHAIELVEMLLALSGSSVFQHPTNDNLESRKKTDEKSKKAAEQLEYMLSDFSKNSHLFQIKIFKNKFFSNTNKPKRRYFVIGNYVLQKREVYKHILIEMLPEIENWSGWHSPQSLQDFKNDMQIDGVNLQHGWFSNVSCTMM
ncbi:hypothetical protein RFI_21571 [Reticulomyxa filosa]|uniref:Uncharacterized protein n=1 Tax=Reticulomyxa filosa TaxID=46433 RepID=X6MRR4_RETFI|nr:hypothetical protein RFI_21571 [Reticulomyxa filosa]|eukprot:ETO15790.1 hypothetical protein RFI_21571 [Reticulomyxa filosa]